MMVGAMVRGVVRIHVMGPGRRRRGWPHLKMGFKGHMSRRPSFLCQPLPPLLLPKTFPTFLPCQVTIRSLLSVIRRPSLNSPFCRVMVRFNIFLWSQKRRHPNEIVLLDACADCKARNPRWASHNLGIFIWYAF